MYKGIGESQKLDNLTLICTLNFSIVKIHFFLELKCELHTKTPLTLEVLKSNFRKLDVENEVIRV